MLQVENTLFTIVMISYFASMIGYFIYITAKKDIFWKVSFVIQTFGFVLHTAAIICRGIGAGRLPLTNQYEFATSFAWGLCLLGLVFMLRFRFRVMGAFISPVMFLMIGYAAMQSKEVRTLMPALRSGWLGFHVSTAIIAYGAFGVSFVLGIIFLLRDKLSEGGFLDQHIPCFGFVKTGFQQIRRDTHIVPAPPTAAGATLKGNRTDRIFAVLIQPDYIRFRAVYDIQKSGCFLL